MKKPKILAPIGYFDTLHAAIEAKADAVYFGIKKLNMRTAANNFKLDDLPKIAQICKKNKIKSFLCLNSIIYGEELEKIKKIIDLVKTHGIDAIIAHDFSVLTYAKKQNVNIHLSTQANISNIEAVKFYSQFANVIVLARELNLKQITMITDQIKKQNIRGPNNQLVEIEIFVHGALCSAISGKCYMSLHQYNKSANRGECHQACRRKYKITEEDTNKELLIDNKHIMSLKDLCTIAQLDLLIKTNASIFKIEGRARSCEYVSTTTQCYKEAVDAFFSNTYTKEKIAHWIDRLSKVYNRGFWHGGYYLDQQTDIWCSSHGSIAKEKKVYLGIATNYFSKLQVGEFLLHSHQVKLGDEILIIGHTTGLLRLKVDSLHTDKEVPVAYKGQKVAIKLNQKIRTNDKLYLVQKNDT